MNGATTSVSLLSRLRDSADDAAWREFDRRYRQLLLRFCWRQGISRVDSEDIVQHVFATMSRTLSGFVYDPHRGRFRDYLYRSTRNAISDWVQRPERRDQALAIMEGVGGRAPEDVEATDRPDWDEEWVNHHYRLALETVRRTFDARNVALFEEMIRGIPVPELSRRHDVAEDGLFKVRQRIRARMQELIKQQIMDEDHL